MKNYIELADEELVKLSHDGDELALEYLIERYKYFVRSKARSYFLVGADHEDIIQEGMIGLYKAARDYRVRKTPTGEYGLGVLVRRGQSGKVLLGVR